MTPSGWAWIGVAAGVAAYDIASPPGQTLSEGVDRWLIAHPLLTRCAVALVAAHLCNLLPDRADPIHLALIWRRR